MIKGYIKQSPQIMSDMIKNEENIFAEVAKDIISKNIKRIILSGSGTSYHVGLSSKDFLQKVTGMQVEVLYPFMVNENIFSDVGDTLLIGISQGGSSISTYNCMKLAKDKQNFTASMSGELDCYIDTIADYIMTVPCKQELAGAKTKGYLTTILNIVLLGLRIGLENKTICNKNHIEYLNRLNKTVENLDSIITKSENWLLNNTDELVKGKDIRIIGTKDNYGNTIEGALKLLETIRVPVSGYEFEEFLHGIYNAINEDSYIIILNSSNESERIDRLIDILFSYTNHIFTIGKDVMASNKNLEMDFVNDKDFLIFEYIIPIQMMCAILPQLKGINPSIPKDINFHSKMGTKTNERDKVSSI